MSDYPSSLDDFSITDPEATDYLNLPPHATEHVELNDAVNALEAKVGIDSSAVTTSHDYKLSEVTSTDKAVGKTATQTMTNKTLTTPTIASFANATHNHTNAAGGGTLTSAALNAGTIAQSVHSATGAAATGTTVMPIDDTIPQNNEGDQYMSLAITPTLSANKLVIEVIAYYSFSIAANMAMALFQDTTADALAAAIKRDNAATGQEFITLRHEMTAGTTSATTFKVRIGSDSAGTTTFNGAAGGRLMGGVLASHIRITEVKV